MAENEVQNVNGTITFANEVVATIAGVTAVEIPGIAGMSGGFKDGIVNLLGRKNLTKGVKVIIAENSVIVDFQIVVEYGVRVPEVAENMQKAVADAIITMTGLSIKAININVQGVKFADIGAVAELTAGE